MKQVYSFKHIYTFLYKSFLTVCLGVFLISGCVEEGEVEEPEQSEALIEESNQPVPSSPIYASQSAGESAQDKVIVSGSFSPDGFVHTEEEEVSFGLTEAHSSEKTLMLVQLVEKEESQTMYKDYAVVPLDSKDAFRVAIPKGSHAIFQVNQGEEVFRAFVTGKERQEAELVIDETSTIGTSLYQKMLDSDLGDSMLTHSMIDESTLMETATQVHTSLIDQIIDYGVGNEDNSELLSSLLDDIALEFVRQIETQVKESLNQEEFDISKLEEMAVKTELIAPQPISKAVVTEIITRKSAETPILMTNDDKMQAQDQISEIAEQIVAKVAPRLTAVEKEASIASRVSVKESTLPSLPDKAKVFEKPIIKAALLSEAPSADEQPGIVDKVNELFINKVLGNEQESVIDEHKAEEIAGAILEPLIILESSTSENSEQESELIKSDTLHKLQVLPEQDLHGEKGSENHSPVENSEPTSIPSLDLMREDSNTESRDPHIEIDHESLESNEGIDTENQEMIASPKNPLAMVEGNSGCLIEQPVCTQRPARIGVFWDSHRASQNSQERCMQRARDFHRYCRNDISQLTVARYYQDGQLLESKRSDDGCIIEQEHCRRNSQKTGAFFDSHRVAKGDKDRCLQRAKEYQSWCGNSYEQVTVAKFFENGEEVARRDSKFGTTCVVDTTSCQKDSKYEGSFIDRSKKARVNAKLCLARAGHYHRWCGAKFDEVVKATFYSDGEATASTDTRSGCWVEMKVCERSGKSHLAGGFFDSHKGADVDQSACLKRAVDYHKYCQNSFENQVKATFYKNGNAIESKTTNSGCVISMKTCVNKSRKAGQMPSFGKKETHDAIACLKLASRVHGKCKNSMEHVVTASFYIDGKLQESHDTTNGCLINLPICAAKSSRAGVFLDTHKSSGTDQVICQRRAHDYHRWCKNSFDQVVTASFYQDGEKIKEAHSQTGCFIEQNICRKQEKLVGFFLDGNKAARYDKDECLERANKFHKRCGNDQQDVTTAHFYKDGQFVEKKSND